MKLWLIAVLGVAFLSACGSDDGGGGSGGSSSGGASTGGASSGGAAGASSGGVGGASGGAGGSSGGSSLDAPGDCMPSEQAGDHCSDATYQYEYFCMTGDTTKPTADCQQPTSPLPAGSGWCCTAAVCQRQKGTEYLCTNAAKPNSYLCHTAAPAPAGCDSVGSIGQQYCCP